MQFIFVFISEPNVLEDEAEEEQAEVMDSDESDMEDAMETNDADKMDTGEGDSAKPKEGKQAKPRRAPPVSSGLPQSKEELEALLSSIHHTVTQSILPRLHKCLIAKVCGLFIYLFNKVLVYWFIDCLMIAV